MKIFSNLVLSLLELTVQVWPSGKTRAEYGHVSFTQTSTNLFHLTALVVGAGELLHGAEVGLAAAVPVAALAALARALLVLVAHLSRVGVQAHAVGHLATRK